MTMHKSLATLVALFALSVLSLRAQILPAPTDGARITFKTTIPLGKHTGVSFVPADETVWVDINNNGICDRGEHASEGVVGKIVVKSFTLVDPTITIYGPVQRFLMGGFDIESIEIDKMDKMVEFQCFGNQIKELDLSGAPGVLRIFCFRNQLSKIDFAPCQQVNDIRCFANQINGDNMTALFNSLPKRTKNDPGQIVIFDSKEPKEQNVCTKQDIKVAFAKWWTVYDLKGDYQTWLGEPYDGSYTASEHIAQCAPTAYYDSSCSEIVLLSPTPSPWQLYSSSGSLLRQGYVDSVSRTAIDAAQLPAGVYVLALGSETIKLIIR